MFPFPRSITCGKLSQRQANWQDASLLFHWTNDPQARQSSIHSRRISWKEHQNWLSRILKDQNVRLFIALKGNVPVGTYRLDQQKDFATVNLSVAPAFRHQGIGAKLIQLIIRTAFSDLNLSALLALVKPDNLPSLSLFQKAGFDNIAEVTKMGSRYIKFRLKNPIL